MKCQVCNETAVHHITDLAAGTPVEFHVCEAHFADLASLEPARAANDDEPAVQAVRDAGCCEVSHGQIRFGRCPWCKLFIGMLESPASSSKQEIHWHPAAVAAGIRSSDSWVRCTTILGLWRGWQFDDEMLGVIAAALKHTDSSVADCAERALQSRARTLTKGEVAILERHSQSDALALVARIMLLTYGCLHAGTEQSENEAGHRVRHTLWLIEHAPSVKTLWSYGRISRLEDRAAFKAATNLWEQHVSSFPRNAQILRNAALFMFQDSPHTGIRLMRQSLELEPDDCGQFVLRWLESIRKCRYEYWKSWKCDV